METFQTWLILERTLDIVLHYIYMHAVTDTFLYISMINKIHLSFLHQLSIIDVENNFSFYTREIVLCCIEVYKTNYVQWMHFSLYISVEWMAASIFFSSFIFILYYDYLSSSLCRRDRTTLCNFIQEIIFYAKYAEIIINILMI